MGIAHTKKKIVRKKTATWRKKNPFKYKLQNLLGSLKRTEQPIPTRGEIELLIKKAVISGCLYCSEPLTLEEMSIDHRLAKERHKEPKYMNSIENLHVVHKQCNRMKGNFNHDEFVRLLNTFSDNKEADKILRSRLKMATTVYGRFR